MTLLVLGNTYREAKQYVTSFYELSPSEYKLITKLEDIRGYKDCWCIRSLGFFDNNDYWKIIDYCAIHGIKEVSF